MITTQPSSLAARPLVRPAYWAALLALAAVAAFLAFTATRLGAGLSDDSYYYIQPAREALAGRGLPLNPVFPPLLPALLASLGLFQIEPLDGIRYLNCFLFGLNVFLSGLVLKDLTRSLAFSLLGALLVGTSEVLINLHAWALSEPLYIALLLGSIVLFGRYLERRTLPWLVLSGLLAGLAALTRYAGVTLVAAGALYLLLPALRRGTSALRPALGPAFLFGLLGSLPLGLYLLRNWLVVRSPFGTRALGWQDLSLENYSNALYNIFIWFIPGRLVRGREIPMALGLLILLLAAAVWLALSRQEKIQQMRQNLRQSSLLGLLFWLAGLNFALLLASRSVFGRGDPFNERYLAPIFVMVLFILVAFLHAFWGTGLRLYQAAVAALALGLVFTFSYRALDAVQFLSENGAGYAGARWHISETVAYLERNPTVPVVATGEVGIYFQTGRLPRSISSFESIPALHAYLAETGAYLVIIDSMPPDIYQVDPEALVDGLKLVYDFSEGTIYQASRR